MTHGAQSQADGLADSVPELVHAEIAAALDLSVHEVLPGCQLVNDYGATVRDLHELWRNLEVHFSLTIPADQVDRWKSVADVVRYIESRLAPERFITS